MNMNIKEWNKVISYAKSCETDCIKVKPYTQHNGAKGIEVQLFDAFGCYFKSAYSGIHDNANDCIAGIKHAINRLYV